jgi:hypothetical protein
MENSFKLDLWLPTNDFTKKESKVIKISTKLNVENNSFLFKAVIPKYIYDYLELNEEKIPSKTMSSNTLKSLVEEIERYGKKCIELKHRENLQSEKYIAVKFNESNFQQKDSFNFASMGFRTTSSFQYFIVYKDIKLHGSLDRYNYKSDVRIGVDVKDRKWYYFGINVIEQGGFKLIKWTQEREDYLKNIQDKFVEINGKLNTFLGNLDEEKINLLMSNKNILSVGYGK